MIKQFLSRPFTSHLHRVLYLLFSTLQGGGQRQLPFCGNQEKPAGPAQWCWGCCGWGASASILPELVLQEANHQLDDQKLPEGPQVHGLSAEGYMWDTGPYGISRGPIQLQNLPNQANGQIFLG